MRIRWLLLAMALTAPIRDAAGQYQTRSWLKWQTIEAGRFSLHFPTELEPWARTVASRIVGIDTAVSRLVGYSPPQHVDVLIDDPFRIPNGSAWPLIDEPRLVLWATPPSPREDIGTFVSWADMLTTHEFAHLAHLLRPTRNRFQSILWKVAPVELGPISRKAPRWLIEGYATYIEGVVTGSGRPNGVWRSTILRQWAIEGTLPTYSQLNTMGGMYGGEFAYLAGSSFLEWLTARRGDSSLVSLWRRLSARRDRGFVEAFAGVYGEGPDILYGRFTAELTAAAKQREAEMRRGGSDTGRVIQHLARETGDPAISRDGGRAVIMLASATRPGRIVIWRTIPETDSAGERSARALVAGDPEDVAPFRPFPPPKRALATLNAVGNQSYQDPRFFRDGRILVWRNSPLGDGSWAPDLYVWDPQRRTVRRLTRYANVRQGDPSPDGATVVATRCAAGKCDLVLVDAKTGKVTVGAEGSDARSFHRPRFSPDGRTIALGVHEGGFWRVGLFTLADRSLRIVTTEPRNIFDAAFADDSTLVATAEEDGLLNIVRLRTDGRILGRITHVSGAAVAPEFNPADGSIWFLALHARGWDVRSSSSRETSVFAPATPALMPRSLPSAPVGAAKPYSPDRKWVYFPGGTIVGEGTGITLGLANTDPAGKHELLIQGAKSLSPHSLDAPLEGAALSLTARSRSPVVVSLFSVRQDGPFWHGLAGATASMDYAVRTDRSVVREVIGGTWSRARSVEDALSGVDRWLTFVDLSWSLTRFREGRRTTAQLAMQKVQGKRGETKISRSLATATVASTEIPFAFSAQYGFAFTDASTEQFHLGGSPPTLLPPGVLSQFIAQPALPAFFVGQHLETYRLSVPIAGARLYGWVGRVAKGAESPYERVIGAEYSASIAAISALGTPAARATLGVGRWMDRRVLTRELPASPVVLTAPPGAFRFYLTTQFGDWSR